MALTLQQRLEIAIELNQLIRFEYNPVDTEEGLPGRRVVEPYVLGRSKYTGNLLLRAWVLPVSPSASNTVPRWRTFRVDRISDLLRLPQRYFFEPEFLYNPSGDGLMSSIIKQARF